MLTLWKKLRYRLEYIGCRTVAILVPILPRELCIQLSKVLGHIYWVVDKRSRLVALANLESAFGDIYTLEQRKKIAQASFQNFARAMLDLFWSPRLNQKNYHRWIKLEGFEHAQKVHDEYGANIFIVMHFGSYEWLSIGAGFYGLPVWIVAQDFKNPSLETIFRNNRQVSGHHLIGRAQSMLRMLKAVKRKDGGAGLLIDLALKPDMASTVINVFGDIKMCVTFLHSLLHERTGVPFTPLTNIPQPDGSCIVKAHPPLSFKPGSSRQEITQGCWDFFEPFIRNNPQLYLWSYKHFRYLPRSSDSTTSKSLTRYPYYAQHSKAFDRLLKETAEKNPG